MPYHSFENAFASINYEHNTQIRYTCNQISKDIFFRNPIPLHISCTFGVVFMPFQYPPLREIEFTGICQIVSSEKRIFPREVTKDENSIFKKRIKAKPLFFRWKRLRSSVSHTNFSTLMQCSMGNRQY